MVTVFAAGGWIGLGLCALLVIVGYRLASISAREALRAVAPLLFIVVLSALLNVFFVQGGEVYVEFGIICISEEGLKNALYVALRLLLLLMGMSLVTLTTTTLDLTEAFEKLLGPLKVLHVPVHELGMIMGIALRYLPVLSEELRSTYRAQLSRGATFTANPFRGGLTSLTSLMVPLFTGSFRHADTLAEAMEARCYHGGNGVTRLTPLTLSARDAWASVVVCLVLALVIALQFLI